MCSTLPLFIWECLLVLLFRVLDWICPFFNISSLACLMLSPTALSLVNMNVMLYDYDISISVLDYELRDLEIPTITVVGKLVKEGIPVLVYRYMFTSLSSENSILDQMNLASIRVCIIAFENELIIVVLQWWSGLSYPTDWK